jgi:hypothetical protein
MAPHRAILHPWNVITPVVLRPSGNITDEFTGLGIHDFRAAAAYVAGLPYGRNADRGAALAVLHEQRGTCSTKHALLHGLAIEQDLDAQLMLAIYLMNARNTPGIRDVLKEHSIAHIPEAHCYIRCDGKRVDATCGAGRRVLTFVHEEKISPEQIGNYKVNLHRRFLRRWAEETAHSYKYGIEELWQIREECISALERNPLQ